MSARGIDIVGDILRIFAPSPRPMIYPSYVAQRIKTALRAPANDPEGVFTAVSDIETVGDCRYAMTVTDFNGSRYRVTVVPVIERAASKPVEQPAHNPDEIAA